MILIGLLLLAAAAAFGIDLVATNAHQVTSPTVFGQTIAVHTDWEVFLVGAVTGAIALLGLALMTGGAGRGMRRRRSARRDEEVAAERERYAAEVQSLRAERDRQAAEHEQVVAERDRLANELDGHRASAVGARHDERLVGAGSADRVATHDDAAGQEPAVDLRDAPAPAAGERELATAGRKRHFWER